MPVVLLHPGWGDSGIWDEIAGKLADGVRVVRYDSLGSGESSAPTERYTALGELRAVLLGRGRGARRDRGRPPEKAEDRGAAASPHTHPGDPPGRSTGNAGNPMA